MTDSWQPEVDELRRREQQAREMGGPEKVRRQHDAGRLTVRERIDALLDAGSFREIGAIAGRPLPDGRFQPANFVFGRGRLDGRPVVVGGDDFTVRGGASDASIREKQIMAEQLAHELRLPLVRLVEGTGGGGSIRALEAIGRTYVPANPGWEWVVANLGTVPVVALALGPVAGLGAARVAASHYSVMVRGAAQVFAAGPPLVARLGSPITKEELGGSEIHGTNGVVTDVVESEKDAFDRARRFLSYLPASVHELPERVPGEDATDRREDWLIRAIPRNRRRAYKIRPIIEAVVDQGSFLELGKGHGRSAVTGLARLDGWPVAVLAGDPMVYGGGMTATSARKIEWFVDLAETFHLPVVHLVDQPGFVIGVEAERAATMRFGVRALNAVYQASVPWCSVILRKVFGVAGAAHTNASRVQYRYAWPSADWGSLPLEGGIEAAYRADLEASDDPEAMLAEIWERMDAIRSPFRTAEAFNIQDIIDPRDTRPLLCEFASLAAPLRTPGPVSWRFRG
ncbi:acyl-CoA carboxylase subunit beta [Pseudonocardia kunmingensis]|uniref:Acetyl-CoA carboxylase carboxyltransferase component n=1 Tax=Pseudonocardia kunmingensis TaxID=630975 RepID=A0A543DI92_9PSEU|nr:carboxyl transferase domain-containing protein [Pseudonocardia kunmingensis]TQM09019.1 acetyl-CoA carboxylase carboxyltransferase component [Pseudonocardia kunmingensis]